MCFRVIIGQAEGVDIVAETVETFLNARREELVVPDGANVLVDPRDEQYQRYVHNVRITGYNDLQALRFVPEHLRETEVRVAIAADDRATLEVARQSFGTPSRPCGHRSGGVPSGEEQGTTTGVSLRSTYARLRPSYHPNLADLVSSAGGSPSHFSDLDVAVIHKRIMTLLPKSGIETMSVLGLCMNVVIGKNSTLTLGPSVKGLHGHDLKIHVGGKLIVKGAGVKLVFHSAQGNVS
jgi:hypothetical protein